MKRTVNVMFRSEFWGQGKTVAALSYSSPGHLSCILDPSAQGRRAAKYRVVRAPWRPTPTSVVHPPAVKVRWVLLFHRKGGSK